MDAFTADELARLRSQPQHFKSKLAVFRPWTAWSGTLNGAHDKGARALTISTDTGEPQDILRDTTLIVGSGINEKRVRIKSASGTFMEVAENSLDWADGDELTALQYWEPFPVFNRLLNDNGTVSHFEDYDISYTDENEVFDPVVNMGPAAFALDLSCAVSGSFVDLEMDASDSFVFDSSISSYQWGILYGAQDAFDAEFVGADDAATATIRFWDTGDYYVSCTITAANGKSYTGYRPVMVRCNTDGQSGSPYFDFNADTLEGSRDTGYWSASLSVFEDCNLDEFPRNVPVVIYGDVVYGHGTDRSTEDVPWHYANTAHQRFVGWIREEAWIDEYKDKGRSVSFEAVGLCGALDEIRNYPAWLRYRDNPSEWTGMVGLTVDRALYYYLRQRSTVLRLTDWHRTGDTKLMQYAEFPDGRMYSGMREFLAGTIFGDLMSDRNSALWAELDGQMIDDAARASVVTNIYDVTDADHMNEITIPTTRDRPEVSWVSIDGLYFDGSENTPLIAYNGYVISSRGGDPETISGLVLPLSQSDLNATAGRLFALRNNPFKSIGYESQGVWPYDIAPQASMRYSGLQSGTFREETITDADLLIRVVNDKLTSDLGLTSELGVEMIIRDPDAVVGPNVPRAVQGVEGIFPPEIDGVDPDDYNTNWPDSVWDWPDYSLPTSEEPSGGILTAGTDTIAAFNFDGYVYRTSNWNDADPFWNRVDLGLTKDFRGMTVDPYSPLYLGTGLDVNAYVIDERYIYYVEDIFEQSGAIAVTQVHDMGSDKDIRTLHTSFGQQGLTAVSDPRGNPNGSWMFYSKDAHLGAAATWSAYQVSTHYTTTGGADERTGIFCRGGNTIYMAARFATGVSGDSYVYQIDVSGASPSQIVWGQLSGNRSCCLGLHFPHDNGNNDAINGDTATTVYHGARDPFAAAVRREVNTVYTDITPTDAGDDYGVAYVIGAEWLIHSYPLNRLYMITCGSRSAGEALVFYSSDGGDSWTLLTGSSDYQYAGISGGDEDVAYLCGKSGKIGFVADLFSGSPPTLMDKNGNIGTDYPGAGNFFFLVGG